ncbi:hypothetical protein ACFSPU_13710 [Haoranjiania flava]|uniref:Uncharacterized protein n=1 Tax=Haoranjiania flava TaxID=1856322 RepID=A0AAE3LKD7_9BACT|nr:hypothetical protein [Haoranjiania flava]MCU7694737.1 hypothetical protein [Haoranjiania flava]
MKKILLTLFLAIGTFIYSNANTITLNPKLQTPDEPTKKATRCELTVTCADGTVVTAEACEKAGKMIDAGCS